MSVNVGLTGTNESCGAHSTYQVCGYCCFRNHVLQVFSQINLVLLRKAVSPVVRKVALGEIAFAIDQTKSLQPDCC